MRRAGMFSTTESIDYSPSTQKTFGGKRVFLLILSILAAISDIVAMIVFAVAGYGAIITIPVLLIVFDALFIVGICFSNFRFKYAMGIWIGYIVFAIILLACIALTAPSGCVIMTDAAIAINALAHIALFGAIIFAGIYPLLKKNKKTKVSMFAITAAAIVLVSAFTLFFSVSGYFGQGFVGEYRVVNYKYDETSDGYIAFSINKGRSKKVVIPETFNGKKVIGVNCNIFSTKDIDDIRLQSTQGVMFYDPELLYFFNEDLRVGVDKDFIDVYRDEYMASLSSFANNLYPCNLAEDETYVTFKYDGYDTSMEIIPTWIGKKGEKFDLSYAKDLEFLSHIDQSNPVDLVWCWKNNNGKILKDFVTSDGKALVGKTVNERLEKIDVSFDKVFKAKVNDDNDDLYEPSKEFKTTNVGDEIYEGRFVTVNTVDDVIGELSRDGFDLKWTYKSDNNLTFENLTSLKTALQLEQDKSKTNIEITPVWSLRAPADLTIEGKDSFVYGDNIKLLGNAIAPNEDCVLEYRWGKGVFDQSNVGKEFVLNNVHPNQSGTYLLYVYASSPNSSLTSFDMISISITVDKKDLNILWTQPDDMVYDGAAKTMTYASRQGDLINGDKLTDGIDVSGETATGANSYTATLTLIGDLDEKYTIVSGGIYSYTIAPCPTQVEWTVGEYTYSGFEQGPSASASDVFGGILPLTIGGNNKVNAGKYTATATVFDKNYTLVDTTAEYEIKQKSITVEWEDKDFVYSGAVQYPKVTKTIGTVVFDNISNQLVYSGHESNINANEGYEVKVSLPNDSNYKFDTEQTKLYNIFKRNISANWSYARSFTYDGNERGVKILSFSNIFSGDAEKVVADLVYGGYGIDVGDYQMEATLSEEASVNYVASSMSCDFAITKREISAVWGQNSFQYDAKAHTPQISSLTNVVDFDRESVINGIQYAGAQTNVGSDYIATATLGAQAQKNYTLKNTACRFSITKAPLYAIWSNTTFTYDKNAHIPFVNSFNGVFEVDRDGIMKNLQYSGMQVNAGRYIASVGLGDSFKQNYWIANSTCEFTIAKAQATAVWSEVKIDGNGVIPPKLEIDSTEYYGEVKVIGYTYRNSDGQVIPSIPSEDGEYTVTVEIESDNYTLTGLQKTFTVSGFTEQEEVA